MTPGDVKKRVEDIEREVGDDEHAHWMEDDLRQDVLKAIAEDAAVDPRTCARLALATREIPFARWYA